MKPLSRNNPIALVVGAAGFIGSHLVEKFLEKDIQVVGIDDLSTGKIENLYTSSHNPKFHFFKKAALDIDEVNLPRLDYAVFLISEEIPEGIYQSNLKAFLDKVSEHTCKILYISSIGLYDSKTEKSIQNLKAGEKLIAQVSAEKKLNARVLRLSCVYGPKMHLHQNDPIIDLLESYLKGNLLKQSSTSDFSSRALFVDDAVNLAIKTLFHGSTSGKIFDGALMHPFKVADIKQIMLDPSWYQGRGFEPEVLPPWPTPNLLRSYQHLSWKPKIGLVEALKKTLEYFKDHKNIIEEPVSRKLDFLNIKEEQESKNEEVKVIEEPVKKKKVDGGGSKKFFPIMGLFLGLLVIGYGLLYPALSLAFGTFAIGQNLAQASTYSAQSKFGEAKKEVEDSQNQLNNLSEIFGSLGFLNLPSDFTQPLQSVIEAASLSISATDSLQRGFLVISGESDGVVKDEILSAGSKYQQAIGRIDQVLGMLENPTNSWNKLPESLISDLKSKLLGYKALMMQGQILSMIVGDLTLSSGTRHYLVVFTDSNISRPSGGVIRAVGDLEFLEGNIKSISTLSSTDIDNKLLGQTQPPSELRRYKGSTFWSLEDIGSEPDFITTSGVLKNFYQRSTGINPDGIVMIDSQILVDLLKATGPINSKALNQVITYDNFVSKLQTDPNPNAVSKEVLQEVLNRLVYSPPKDLSEISRIVSYGTQGHTLGVHLNNPKIQPLLSSAGWSGTVMEAKDAQDVLGREVMVGVYQMNMSNAYIKKTTEVEVGLNKDGGESVKLKLSLNNPSKSTYVGVLKIYLPSNFKQIEGKATLFSDYKRAGFLVPLEITQGASQEVMLSFESTTKPKITSDQRYNIKILKQPGVLPEELSLKVNIPKELKLVSTDISGLSKKITLDSDFSGQVTVKK